MRLQISRNAAGDRLTIVLNDGYELLKRLGLDHQARGSTPNGDPLGIRTEHDRAIQKWTEKVKGELKAIFPTELEAHTFLERPQPLQSVVAKTTNDYQLAKRRARLRHLLQVLAEIRNNSLGQYVDLPEEMQLYIEDIDSFSLSRNINPSVVQTLLTANGRCEVPEDHLQRSIEEIIGEPFHKKDWGGEQNDLFTSNILVNGKRRATAFLLKGKGLKVKTMEIKHCGKNGDQLVRLFDSPAELFVVQYVGNISEAVVKDVRGKLQAVRAKGMSASCCIINGLDTARLLYAYGKLETA